MAVKNLDGRVGIRDSVQFDPRKIVISSGHNPRSPEELRKNVDALKPQIRASGGVLQPLWIREDGPRCTLIDGESRLTAVLELIAEGMDIPSVPTVAFKAGDEASQILLSLQANQGKPLEPWEMGAAFIRLSNVGWDEAKIAAKMGISERVIRDSMTMAETPVEMRKMLSEGVVTPARVVAEVKAVGPAEATRKIKAAVAESGGEKVARERKVVGSIADLKAAALTIISEADQNPDAMIVEIHRDNIRALRVALGA